MNLKDSFLIIFTSIFAVIATIGDLFSNIVIPLRNKFDNIQITSVILIMILFSAALLFLYILLEKSNKATPLKLKLTKYTMILSLSISIIFTSVFIVPNITTNSNSNSNLPKEEKISSLIDLEREKQKTIKQEKELIELKLKYQESKK